DVKAMATRACLNNTGRPAPADAAQEALRKKDCDQRGQQNYDSQMSLCRSICPRPARAGKLCVPAQFAGRRVECGRATYKRVGNTCEGTPNGGGETVCTWTPECAQVAALEATENVLCDGMGNRVARGGRPGRLEVEVRDIGAIAPQFVVRCVSR